MKVALCLCGQPRWFLECSKYFLENIIQNFNHVDVFIHAWFDGQDYESSISDLPEIQVVKNTPDLLLETFNPKKIKIEKPKKFVDNQFYPYPKSTTLPNNAFSMFYSIKSCIKLLSEVENEENFQYDWVFRSRFDYAINRKFNEEILQNLEPNAFYSPHVITKGNPHCHCDFNFGGSKIMKIYSSTFDNLQKFGEKEIILANEAMTYNQLIENDIDVKEFDLHNQFPPSQHSACWHSLWGHR